MHGDIQRKFLVYEASLSFLKSACNASRGLNEARVLQTTVDDCIASMTMDSAVRAIAESLECRKRVWELSSELELTDDPNLLAAIRKDEERIATFLVSIFGSKSDEETVLRLEGDSAQHFLDVAQEALDRGFLVAQEHARMALRIIRKLSESCNMLPSSLFIVGVNGRDEHPSFGGGFGDIYSASYGDQRVALKRMRHFLYGSDLRRIRLKFCREALLWKDLHHSNILPFLGIDRCSFPSFFCMASPWMEHGTVMNYLRIHGHANVDKLLYHIAQGLEYLHSRNIVHGDLRGANILIKEDCSACLADFGLSVLSDITSLESTNRGGNSHWMAPELLDPPRFGLKFLRTQATDVYAFGCVCFELYTERPPFASVSDATALLMVLNGERPERPPGPPAMSDILWKHITEFWAESPTARPSAQLVVQNMAWPIPNPGSSVCSPFIATGNLPGSSSPAADESSSSAVVVCHSAITSSPNHHQAPYPPQPNLAPFPALYLYPIDDSFVPRRVALGGGQRVKIGRRTNAKAQPGETNGYFFSRVLSRQHAEVWEQGGRIFIQDVKSANGTFINGERLSLDGHESEPHELKSDDILEFGVDVVGEDNKTVMHHKVVARVACVFPDKDGNVETPPVWPDTQPEVDAPTNATAGDEDAKPKDKAEARYASTPPDGNDISFSIAETLNIVGQAGKSSQVKRADRIIVAPSNYLEIIPAKDPGTRSTLNPDNETNLNSAAEDYTVVESGSSVDDTPTNTAVWVSGEDAKPKAKARFPYTASPDSNLHEISFRKGEILDIIDQGMLCRKQYWESVGKRAKDKAWLDVFVVIQKGELNMFTFGDASPGASGTFGGGNWLSNARPVGTVQLAHSLAHSLPSPGYNRQRPYCMVLTLANGGVYFFQAGTEELVNEWVSTCNYWAARTSKEPLAGGVSNMEYGWNRLDDTTGRRSSLSDADPLEAPEKDMSDMMSVRSGRSKFSGWREGSATMRGSSPWADRTSVNDWKPPLPPPVSSPHDEETQLEALRKHVVSMKRDLKQHNEYREAMAALYQPRSANAIKAQSNWEKKSQYLLTEIVKYDSYIDSLQAAMSLRLKKRGEKALERALSGNAADDLSAKAKWKGPEEETIHEDDEPLTPANPNKGFPSSQLHQREVAEVGEADGFMAAPTYYYLQ